MIVEATHSNLRIGPGHFRHKYRGIGMKRLVFLTAFVLVTSPVFAESVTVRCPLVRQFSELQVNILLNQASSVVGEQDAQRIHAKYVSLKNECSMNGDASRTISISGRLKDWLKENGVDLYKIASRT
jgi:hypothetical protein